MSCRRSTRSHRCRPNRWAQTSFRCRPGRLTCSRPTGSGDGTRRVTEQGEMIQAKFGLPGIAVRTLEVYTTATLNAALAKPRAIDPRWRSVMDRLAASAHAAFRQVVHDDPRFPS